MNLKTEILAEFLKANGKAAVALSGGLDSSTLLAFCVKTLGAKNCTAFIATLKYSMQSELEDAKNLCAALGVKLVNLEQENIPQEIEFNPPDRCYLCKRAIFTKLKAVAKEYGFEKIYDGTNADDLSDYRPGMRALKELNIESPFLACKMGKDEIRLLANSLNLKVANKPAYACLLTRLEHNKKIDTNTLVKIDKLESFLRANFTEDIRARVEGENVRIECKPSDFQKIIDGAESICKMSNSLGFKRISLDLQGYKRGSMNIVL